MRYQRVSSPGGKASRRWNRWHLAEWIGLTCVTTGWRTSTSTASTSSATTGSAWRTTTSSSGNAASPSAHSTSVSLTTWCVSSPRGCCRSWDFRLISLTRSAEAGEGHPRHAQGRDTSSPSQEADLRSQCDAYVKSLEKCKFPVPRQLSCGHLWLNLTWKLPGKCVRLLAISNPDRWRRSPNHQSRGEDRSASHQYSLVARVIVI